jgi:hypothetical protein
MKNLKTFEDYSDLHKQDKERAERNQISNFPHSAKEAAKKKEKREKRSYKEDPDGMYPRDDKRYDDSSSHQGGWQDGMGKPSWLGESVEDEEIIKVQFNKWYDSIDYTEADYASFKAGYKTVISMLPTEKDAKKHANGSYGYPDNYEDSRVISAGEDGFVSGCEWVLNELENKLKENK